MLGFGFVNFDDPLYVTANPQVQAGLTRAGLFWAFTSVLSFNWSPVTLLSHMLDAELFGTAPAGHHATSLLLHVCNALLVYELLLHTTRAVVRSAAVALLFAVHPLHVESVAWVAERKDVLSTLFWLLTTRAWVAWTQHGGAARYALATGCFALGLAAKPMLVSLPLTLLLLDYWPLGRLRAWREAWPRLVEKLPLLALAVALGIVTLIAQQGALVPASLPLELRVANALGSAAAYLGKAVWPAGLSPLYPHPYLPGMGGEPLGAARVAGAALLLLLVTAGALASRRAWAVTGWLWYLVTLFPVIGIVQVGGQGMADRYTYVPLLGVFVIAAWAVAELDARLRARRPALSHGLRVASVAALATLAVAASQQARHWRDSEALWSRALAVAPGSVAHFNMGLTLRDAGRFDEAGEHFRSVLAYEPRSTRALDELALTLEHAGNLEEAEGVYRASISVGPRNAPAHHRLGKMLERQGRLTEAIEHYRAAQAANPRSKDVKRSLERALARQAEGS